VIFANDEWGDQLNDHLDALAAGESPRDLDPADAETVRRFFARDDAPPPSRDLTSQIWKDLMNQSAPGGTIPLRPPLAAPPPLNGRTRYRPWRQGPPRLTTSHHQRRWSYAQLAAAFLLVVTVVAGYFVFGPLRPDSDQPRSIPAAVVPAATPSATPFPRAGHPIIGVWKVDVDPGNPSVIWHPTFGKDGTYVMYDTDSAGKPTVSIGTWKPTGEHSVELVFIMQPIVPQDMFDPTRVLKGSELKPSMEIWRLTLTLDETGNTMTSRGGYEEFDDQGTKVFSSGPVEMNWTRMVPDPTAPVATPTS
jgi:hypothetical protein